MRFFEKIRKTISSGIRAWNETYSKRLFTLIAFNAILWVWCSYILAWFGRYEIAQELSRTAITCILGVVITNASKSALENVSKYGWKGRNTSENSEAAVYGDNSGYVGEYSHYSLNGNMGASGSSEGYSGNWQYYTVDSELSVSDTGFGDDEGIGGA